MDGKVVIVTGATSGIGEAAAVLLAGQGAKVVAAGRREARGTAVVQRIRDMGGEAMFVRADMASDTDIRNLVETAVRTYGGLDCAFNNAGMGGQQQQLHEYTDENWDAQIAVNLTGVYRCMKYQIAAMLESGARKPRGAAIVNTASTLGHRASPLSGPAYTASKHAVIGLSKQAAISYIRQNIRVNVVSPGATRTELLEPLMAMGPDVVKQVNEINPIGRMATAEEVAQAVVFLLSDAAAMITGHALPVDGGQLAKL
ncbi:glucose 1-dehydrogenase [Iodidimonas sp. SYSU 1G8]|uniref:glucose 1-dehydrogenase n=1 Tax=Iodidimonas sp. SYSU 1G8 TaxID=3133967 RepID=UPI0031FF2260